MYPIQFELQSVFNVVAEDLAANYDPLLFSPTPVPTGYFRGMVRSPSGKPVVGISVTAIRTDEILLGVNIQIPVTKWTGYDGTFEFKVSPGTYIIGINIDDPDITRYPYPPTYFPGTTERASAIALTLKDGQTTNVDLAISRLIGQQ
jgi:hypothetical protein